MDNENTDPAHEFETASLGGHMVEYVPVDVEDDDAEAYGPRRVEDVEAEAEDNQPAQEKREPMSRAAFCALWEHAFNLPAMMRPEFEPLAITAEKKPASDEAANAAYDLIEMHFPHLLVSENPTFTAIARMLPFLYMQAAAVRAILLERRRARMETNQGAASQAANDPEPPTFKSGRDPSPAAWMDAEEGAAA